MLQSDFFKSSTFVGLLAVCCTTLETARTFVNFCVQPKRNWTCVTSTNNPLLCHTGSCGERTTKSPTDQVTRLSFDETKYKYSLLWLFSLLQRRNSELGYSTQQLFCFPTTKTPNARKRLLSVSVESWVSLRASTVTVFVYRTWVQNSRNLDQNVGILVPSWWNAVLKVRSRKCGSI